MDHFYQLPMLGDPDAYMLECYALLAALARETSTVRLSALVTGNTYRVPAVLAKTITTLDIVSNGRAQLGIGAGWFELEHDAFGIEFGTFTDRFEKLEESLQIVIPMLRGERPSLAGKHYTVSNAMNEPPAVSADPRDDRWRWREENAADGRPVRRRVEPDLHPGGPAAQARRAGRTLSGTRTRSVRDHGLVAAHCVHRPDAGGS